MKKLAFIILCITLSLGVFAHEPDTLSVKDHIFYHYDRSEFNEVVRLCEEALVVYESTNDLFEMAGCYNLLGIAYQRLGRFKEAIESYELCAETMERLKNSEYELHQMGAAAFYDKSITEKRKAIIAKRSPSPQKTILKSCDSPTSTALTRLHAISTKPSPWTTSSKVPPSRTLPSTSSSNSSSATIK